MKESIFPFSPLAFRLLEISPAAIVIVDEHEKIVYRNRRLMDWLGYSGQQILSDSIQNILLNFSLCDLATAEVCQWSHTETTSHDEGPIITALKSNGHGVLARVSVHPVVSSKQKLTLVHLIAEDDTRVDQELLQSEKLAAIARMVTGLSHESRNALQTAVASLDLLELDLKKNPEQMELSQRIRESLSDIFANYDEVRRYAEPIQPRQQMVNLVELFQTVFNETLLEKDRFNDTIGFRKPVTPRCSAAVDREQMRRVFRHLIENAMDASDDLTQIELECFKTVKNHQPMIGLRVFDRGEGMNDCDLPRVFEPFYTTKQHGTGLGLAVCRRIIEAHGGRIHTLGHQAPGACIELTVPASSTIGESDNSTDNGR